MNEINQQNNHYRWRGLLALLLGTFSVVLSLSFLFPYMTQLQEYAKAHGMQLAFGYVSLILLFVSVIGLTIAFFVKAKVRSQEDLSKLRNIQTHHHKAIKAN